MRARNYFLNYRKLLITALGAALLLLVPYIAMQFTTKVAWGFLDFVVAWLVMFGAGTGYLIIASGSSGISYRVGAAIAAGAALMLIWINLAVGIIGSGPNTVNLMYIGVIATAALGSAIARLKAREMATTMVATAIFQSLVAIMAFILGMHKPPVDALPQILGINGFFIMIWLLAAVMFSHSARRGEN